MEDPLRHRDDAGAGGDGTFLNAMRDSPLTEEVCGAFNKTVPARHTDHLFAVSNLGRNEIPDFINAVTAEHERLDIGADKALSPRIQNVNTDPGSRRSRIDNVITGKKISRG